MCSMVCVENSPATGRAPQACLQITLISVATDGTTVVVVEVVVVGAVVVVVATIDGLAVVGAVVAGGCVVGADVAASSPRTPHAAATTPPIAVPTTARKRRLPITLISAGVYG